MNKEEGLNEDKRNKQLIENQNRQAKFIEIENINEFKNEEKGINGKKGENIKEIKKKEEKKNRGKNNDELKENDNKDSDIIEGKNGLEENNIIEQYENKSLSFYIYEDLIKIINDKTLREDILFSKIMQEIKIPSKNFDD